jgi:phytoene synthase
VARPTSFYYSFLALPAPKRRALTAVFDFCRAVDDGVDLAPDRASAEAAVRLWRGEVERVFSAAAPETVEGRQLQETLSRIPLSRPPFDALVDGVAMDIDPRRYETFGELEVYCHHVASAVGVMCIEVFGYRNPSVRDYARDLGVALQLTNILRDVGSDFQKGRVYLPAEDLARFGCSAESIGEQVRQAGSGVRQAALRSVLEHHASRARVFFARAERALPGDERPTLVAAEIMRAIYADLLRRIEAAGFDVFSGRIRVPRIVQARIALGAWWRARKPVGTR